MKKPTMWFPNRSDTSQVVRSQKQARSLKFWILNVEALFYPIAKTKALITCYREADLHLCFRICRLLVFSGDGSFEVRSLHK